MLDNIWKYSISGSSPSISVTSSEHGFIEIIFTNISAPIAGIEYIFEKGYQEDQKSEGFGYGLFWTTLLVSHYNELATIEEYPLTLSHTQDIQNMQQAKQIFTLRNIRA